MGNEQSQLSGLEIEEKALEITDFWSHHAANIHFGNVTRLSVFVGEELIGGSLWLKQTPLEKCSKNLMVYRHPCILKYISSWQKGSKFFLAVEEAKPLFQMRPLQNNLQICIGLHSILKALCFLHEKASMSHNNVCTASIYVTKDGNWKLGAMEYLCKYEDLTPEYLSKTRNHRYDKAVDPNEDKNLQTKNVRKDIIDVYAFGVLVTDVLKRKNEDIPSLNDFLELCKNYLENSDILLRPKLSDLLDHPFFNHDFINIHCFLTELPLKDDSEKIEFFLNLANRLRNFEESVVASQLGNLILSRMVLLNKTAQTNFIPFVLCPQEGNASGLFSAEIFKKYLVPKLLEIYCVRDAQIRFLLLDHFIHYMNCFTKEELQMQVLPELLVGIKDTNDDLVSVTLRALADLVPVLGSSTVIGGKRAKLFNDGRPIVHSTKRSRRNSRRNQEVAAVESLSQSLSSDVQSVATVATDVNQVLELSQRPSPDGEEGENSAEEIEAENDDGLGDWEDWGVNEEVQNSVVGTEQEETESSLLSLEINDNNIQNWNSTTDLQNELQNVQIAISSLNVSGNKKSMPDISELDIKNQINSTSKLDDIDFFQDMEPVIESSKYLIEPIKVDDRNEEDIFRKLNLGVIGSENQIEGWGDDLDWD